MNRTSLSRSEIKELNDNMGFDFTVDVKGRVESIEDKQKIILLDGKPVLFNHSGKWLPTLHVLQAKQLLKKITVDMGAIKFVTSGADVMRPGITAVDDGIAVNEAVVVVDQNYGKALAVGIALFSSEEIRAMQKGKAVKNIHFIGDDIWNFGKEV